MFAVYKKEMMNYFITPAGYVFAAIFFAISGAVFALNMFMSQSTATGEYFIIMLFCFIVLIPLLTMKLFSEERRSKTEQILLTSPVSLVGMITAKFLAAYTLFAATLIASTALNLATLSRLAKATEDVITKLHMPTVIGSVVGILLVGGVFIAIGCFLSSLTESQSVAAVSSIGAFVLLFLFSLLPGVIGSGVVRTVIKWFSVFDRFYSFPSGVFDLTAVVYYISLMIVFLFLTVRVYEKRRWN